MLQQEKEEAKEIYYTEWAEKFIALLTYINKSLKHTRSLLTINWDLSLILVNIPHWVQPLGRAGPLQLLTAILSHPFSGVLKYIKPLHLQD